MKRPTLLVVAALLTMGAAEARAIDLAVAEKTYATVCANCHGRTGKGMASFPSLAGQEADYIALRLKQYRAGEKVGPNTPLMMPQATELSDDEIASLSAYIATSFK